MAKLKLANQAAQLGMGTLVAGLKTLERGVSKRKFKKVLATVVAQLLAMHPDLGAGQARRRARKVVGVKPSRNLLKLGQKVSETLKTVKEKDAELWTQQA